MVGRIESIKNKQMDDWMDRKNNEKIDGWFVGRITNILKKQMDGQMDKNRRLVGWIENNR